MKSWASTRILKNKIMYVSHVLKDREIIKRIKNLIK